MTHGAIPLSQAPLRRFTPQAAALLLVAVVAWAVTVERSRVMGGAGPGSMGLQLPAFLVMWTPMMAAMMLPAVAPLASIYSRTVRTHRAVRLTTFALGYLAVWAAAGVPAFAVAWGAGRLADGRPGLATAGAVVAYATCGIYQLTSWKNRCLRHCRSPLALLLRYGSYRGSLRDLAAGVHHGAYCAGCCWALFVVLVALGVMNLAAMVVLAVVVLLEKSWSRGIAFSRIVGVGALALAVAVVWVPSLAPGLHGAGAADPLMMSR
jgi:predicted metal-binding membrane protein